MNPTTAASGARSPVGQADPAAPRRRPAHPGIARITPEHLERIVTVLEVGSDQAQKFDELRRRADERGWWQEYSDIIAVAIETLVEIGEDAISARSYDIAFVQGLL